MPFRSFTTLPRPLLAGLPRGLPPPPPLPRPRQGLTFCGLRRLRPPPSPSAPASAPSRPGAPAEGAAPPRHQWKDRGEKGGGLGPLEPPTANHLHPTSAGHFLSRPGLRRLLWDRVWSWVPGSSSTALPCWNSRTGSFQAPPPSSSPKTKPQVQWLGSHWAGDWRS